MDRLAEWTGEEWIARQERLNGKIVGNSMCMKRLAEYEDIGLTPEQLTEIDKLYSEKCREVAELRKQLSEKTTAYDVDKAIEKLESKARGEWGYPSVMEFEDVINIVKAGGVDE